MAEADDARDQAARTAQDAAIKSAADTVVYLAIMFGLSYAITHRYVLEQIGASARYWWRQWRDPRWREKDRAVAELRRKISEYEHQAAAADRTPRRGMYEPGSF